MRRGERTCEPSGSRRELIRARILDWALKVLRRPKSDHGVLAMNILSHSPLPAAAEQIRQILRTVAVQHLRLLAERGEETAKRLLAEPEP